MKQVNIHQAKTELSKLLEEVEAGESVVIARAGEPIAVLTRYRPPARKRRLGLFRGQVKIHDDFDELPEEFAELLGPEK